MEEKELKIMLEAETRGIEAGIKLMQNRMLHACKNRTPIELPDGKAYWNQSDLEHLRQVMDLLD